MDSWVLITLLHDISLDDLIVTGFFFYLYRFLDSDVIHAIGFPFCVFYLVYSMFVYTCKMQENFQGSDFRY